KPGQPAEQTAGQTAGEPAPVAAQSDGAADAGDGGAGDEGAWLNMYRLYNPFSGEHFYTASLGEARSVAEAGWRWEGVGWVAPAAGDPVFRLYNPFAGDHHYTLSAAERDHLASLGWRYEGVGWMSDASAGSLAVLRQYNPNAAAGAHNFTLSAAEDGALASLGWRREGVGWRAADRARSEIEGFWLVTPAWGSLGRYWVGADCEVARGRLVDPAEGSGWWAWATDSGDVVRGALDRGDGWAWLADADGRLATGDGWAVTDAYGRGLQRYFLSDQGDWAYARVGLFEVDGKRYYGRKDLGFVVRGTYVISTYTSHPSEGSNEWVHDDTVVIANNDGVLLSRDEVGWRLVDAARSQVGASYSEIDNGYFPGVAFNCSGFSWWVYSTLGINLSHNQGYYSYFTGQDNTENSQMWGVEKRGNWRFDYNDLRPGDLVFFSPAGDKYHTGHVGVYIGGGQMIDSIGAGVYVRDVGSSGGGVYVGGGFPITLI
ncbi:MAG: C40 family peptidase, partial [Olsenella sp.]|nr:C40 family peptidase [Olsenella sp.]